AAELANGEHGHHHGHAPPPGDDDPAAVLRLRLRQQDRGHDAIAKQDQERRPDGLGRDDVHVLLLLSSGSHEPTLRPYIVKPRSTMSNTVAFTFAGGPTSDYVEREAAGQDVTSSSSSSTQSSVRCTALRHFL